MPIGECLLNDSFVNLYWIIVLTESLLWDIIILTIYLHGTMIKYKIKAAWEV